MRRKIGAIISVVLVLGVGGVSYFSGGELGGECHNDFFGCKGAILDMFGPTCLMDMNTGVGYCTVECDSNTSCTESMGPGWGCYGAEIIDEYGNKTAETERVCYSPQDVMAMRAAEGGQTNAPGIPAPAPPAPGQPAPAQPAQPVPGQPVPAQPAPQPAQ